MNVMKFGGTSIGDAARVQEVVRLVDRYRDHDGTVVVVSAVAGITDLLIAAAQNAVGGEIPAAQNAVDKISYKHRIILDILSLYGDQTTSVSILDLLKELQSLVQNITVLRAIEPAMLDYITGIGERLSSRLVAGALCAAGYPAEAVDATEFLITDDEFGNAHPRMDYISPLANARLKPLLIRGVVPVVTGFIGATAEGVATTLGRGGSDYSATILGSVLGARAVFIWTDVDGIMTADPHLVPGARTLSRISYQAASALSYFGAKVLHPKTVAPAINVQMPIHIRNSFHPDAPGTIIDVLDAEEHPLAVTSISQLCLLTVQGSGVIDLFRTAMLIFSVLAQEGINVLISQFSYRYNIYLIIEQRQAVLAVGALNKSIDSYIKHGKIIGLALQKNIAIVTIVGANLYTHLDIIGRIINRLNREQTDILALAQDSSGPSLSFIVPAPIAAQLVQNIHKEF